MSRRDLGSRMHRCGCAPTRSPAARSSRSWRIIRSTRSPPMLSFLAAADRRNALAPLPTISSGRSRAGSERWLARASRVLSWNETRHCERSGERGEERSNREKLRRLSFHGLLRRFAPRNDGFRLTRRSPRRRSYSPAVARSRSAQSVARAPTSSPIRATPRSSSAHTRPSRISSTTSAPFSARPV